MSTVIGSPAPTATPTCDERRDGPPSISSVFVDLPRHFFVKEICAADVGPGLAAAEVVAELSDLAAGEVTQTDTSPDSDDALKALVGTVESGNGDAFVDMFMSRVGEARNDTVTLGGHVVRYFNTPGGEGYAYAEGPTVAIGYIPPPRHDLASTQESAKEVFTRVLAATTGTPIPADGRTERGIETYAPGRGRYTTPDDPGWVFFKTESPKGVTQMACGIAPNGTSAGCDIVPRMNAPSGTNQTVVDASAPAHYGHSDTPTFTRDVDILLEGHRLDNGKATCGRAYQGTVRCVIGGHSFVVSHDYGVLE